MPAFAALVEKRSKTPWGIVMYTVSQHPWTLHRVAYPAGLRRSQLQAEAMISRRSGWVGFQLKSAGLRAAREEKFHALALGEKSSEQFRSRAAAISGVMSRCASPSIS
jgi:hypothetical protein